MPPISPTVIDAIFALIAIEYLGGRLWLARRGALRFAPPFALFLLSGAFLMAALRFSLAGGPDYLIGAALLFSFLAHAACLYFACRLVIGDRKP